MTALQKRIDQLETEKKTLIEENRQLKENIPKQEKWDVKVRSEVEKILRPIFSDTQIHCILDKKSVRHWADEDIASALTLRSMSRKCYEYLRKVKGIPLPSKSTLNARARDFPCEPGILHAVLSLMKSTSETMTQMERVAVLSFDEMSISSEWNYDKGSDTLFKPHDKVMVYMVRGLVGNWKQPVYFNFDESYRKKVLLNIIKEVENAGYPIVAIVHDMGPTNLRLWKDFKIDPTESKTCSFQNPFADRNIFLFADVPHLLKLIRNNFIDSGFDLANGAHVSDAAIRKIMSMKKTEYCLIPKISELHLNVYGQQRQRVKYAAHLLSESCSKAITFFLDKGTLKSGDFRETADFIDLVDKWFDVLNSSRQWAEKKTRNAFGVHLDEQKQILYKMMYVARTMRVRQPKRKGLFPFQKGLLVSSQSLLGLYVMLKEKFNIEYILTRKLNQDCLEHMFGCIRQMEGTFDHPNAITFKNRLKKLLLGRNAKLLAIHANCEEEEFEDFNPLSSLNGKANARDSFNKNELAKELLITALSFQDVDFSVGPENYTDEEAEEVMAKENTPDNLMDEESLRYIGGYIVKKFINKYPYLGKKEDSCVQAETWINYKNRGGLYSPSDCFYLQLSAMRKAFLGIHGASLVEGKNCVKEIVDELKLVVENVPQDVMYFFSLISIYFKIRDLNRDLRMNRKKSKLCRNEDKKRKKLR